MSKLSAAEIKMKINSLKLTNYRNHLDLKLELGKNSIQIIGENGVGKTNVLESIYFLSTGKSPRSKYDSDLINYDKNFCTVDSKVLCGDQDFNLEFQIIKSGDDHRSSKKAKVNKVPKTINYFCGIFNSVLFLPEDIQLITGPPSDRRRYMDSVLTQVSQGYKKNLSSYTKAVKQRNKILEKINKEGRGWDEIDYWTEQVFKFGNILQDKRTVLFENLENLIQKNAKELNNNKTTANIIYKKNELTRERLEKYREKEILAKSTLLGPHRDDFEIIFNEHPVAEFGSRVEQRSVVLALKLSEIEYIEKEKGEKPVLLLDDIFSELDEKHKEAVSEIIKLQQTILTSTKEQLPVEGSEIIKLPSKR